MSGWESGDNTPISSELNAQFVFALESVSSVWAMVRADKQDESPTAVPVLILTFHTRNHVTQTVVLSMSAVATLSADIAQHLINVCGGALPVDFTDITDEGLSKLINDIQSRDRTEDEE